MKNNERGITLIALIITVIVLLILAGTAISIALNGGDIFGKAQTAREEWNVAVQKEEVELQNAIELLNTISNDSKQSETTPNESILAATLFEDKAGDEEGATVGKIHIGDYINYNPIAQGDTGTEEKYKYESLNEYTGITEAISANVITGFTDQSQIFTAKNNLTWRVIGLDGNNILITTENPILPDNAISLSVMGNQQTGYYLYSAKGYVNISPNEGERNEINNISKIYGNGKGAEISKTRGMSIEDVNYIVGTTVTENSIIPIEAYTTGTSQDYGTVYTEFRKGNDNGWPPEAWINSNIDKTNSVNAPGHTGKVTHYMYQKSNSYLKTANSLIRANLLFTQSEYWLASRSIVKPTTEIDFGVRQVGSSYAGGASTLYTGGNSTQIGWAKGIRPVVALQSNISLSCVGTSGSIATWNIE